MSVIYKYELELTDSQVVTLRNGAKILDVQLQKGKIVFWAVIDKAYPEKEVEFLTFGTGGSEHAVIPDKGYIGTVQQGDYVWHVFARDV